MAEAHSFADHPKKRYLLLLDGAVLVGLAALVLYTVSKHEPWADEAQAWLLARDFNWFRLVFSELRYEGHPPLWFAILWIAIHIFRMPYAYLGYLGAVFAIAGLGVLTFLAPFPRFLRYLIGSSFFFVYQYAVLARPYVLIPLLGFLGAYFYRHGLPKIITFAVVIAVLMQVSSYAAVIALSLTISYALQLFPRSKNLTSYDRKRIIAATSIIALSAIFLVVVLFPPSDSFLMAQAAAKTLGHHLQLVQEGLTGALVDFVFLTIALLALASVWAYQRGALPLLILSVGGTALEYGFVRGYSQHQGLITIAFVVFLWAAWPTAEQIGGLRRSQLFVHRAMLASLVAMFAWHCTWAYTAIRNDWAGPYTGALEAARFLKSVQADKLGCNGIGFWAVAVQPYFERNIFLNYGGPDAPAAHHWSNAFYSHADFLSPQQIQNRPRYILVADEESFEEVMPLIEGFKGWNYKLIHYSDGTRFFKNTPGTHSLYLIFERMDAAN